MDATITQLLAAKAPVSALQDKITSLRIAVDSKRTVEEVRELRTQEALYPLDPLVSLLSNPDLADAVTAVFLKLLVSVDFSELVQYEALVLSGLQDASPDVRRLSLDAIRTCVHSKEIARVFKVTRLWPAVLQCLEFHDTAVAVFAIHMISHIIELATPESALDAPTTELLGTLLQSTNGKFRTFELLAQVSAGSDSSFEIIEKAGLFNSLIQNLYHHDILERLNILEILAMLLEVEDGFTFLDRTGVIESMCQSLDKMDVLEQDDETTRTLFHCALLKFMGKIPLAQDFDLEAAQKTYFLADRLGRELGHENVEIKEAAIIGVGNFGSDPRGLRLLANPINSSLWIGRFGRNSPSSALEEFSSIYRRAVGSEKVVAMMSFACILSSRSDEGEQITEDLFNMLGNPLKDLLKSATSPIEELRTISYSILRGIASKKWGAQRMTESDVASLILDRRETRSKLDKEWRYTVIEQWDSTLRSASISADGSLRDRMAKYIREGPFYVPQEVQVATMV
ncbi:26S proteasome non-ATPase regulatory subunit 5 [Cladochytrium replicatum]|nr:26S proteasome non-ATPase regulatory subunit 5 [Cladochytrium replicatum]